MFSKQVALFLPLLLLTYFIGIITPNAVQAENSKPTLLTGKVIVIDPGHGGSDLGACTAHGTQEHQITLEIGMRLKNLLADAGAKVIMTRTSDTDVGLYERAHIANSLNADLFVSIHLNNHPNHSLRGIEVYYCKWNKPARGYALCVLSQAAKYTGLEANGVELNDFVVIRETQMPSILVELGYLSNVKEEKILVTPGFADHAAEGIYHGMAEYFK